MLHKLIIIAQRHGMNICTAALYEIFIRGYRKKYIRWFYKILHSERNPAGVYFVLGCYNSGTTIIKDAIGLHPDVTTAPIEGDVLTAEFSTYEADGWSRCMYARVFDILESRKGEAINSKRVLSDWSPWIKRGKAFLEKSISHTVRIPHLRKAFRNTKFIYVTRDMDAVVAGIQRRSTPAPPAKLICGEKYPDKLLQQQWRFFNEIVLLDAKNHDDVLIISYEKFLSEPKKITEQMYTFLCLQKQELTFVDNFLRCGASEIFIKNTRATKNLAPFLENERDLRDAIERNFNGI